MPDWLAFSILDMTPYDRRGWLRLIESYQQDFTYLPWLSLLFSAILAIFIFRPRPNAPRFALVLLASSWLWCGWVFQMQYHANLNWAAPQFTWVFSAQAALLVLVTLFSKTLSWRFEVRKYQWPSLLILLMALLYPLIGLVEGRSFSQTEWVGLMPTPTTLATLGVVILLTGRWTWLLLPIPVIWGLVSAAFTWRLELFEPYILAVALMLCVLSYLAVGRQKA